MDYKAILNSELKHHGILGMKWGFRKNRSASANQKKFTKKDV